MKYAIVDIGGRQCWVKKGKYYNLNCIPTELGKEIILNCLLLLNDGNAILIGKSYLNGATVKGNVLEHLRDQKKMYTKCNPKND